MTLWMLEAEIEIRETATDTQSTVSNESQVGEIRALLHLQDSDDDIQVDYVCVSREKTE